MDLVLRVSGLMRNSYKLASKPPRNSMKRPLGRGFLTNQIKRFEDLAPEGLQPSVTALSGRKLSTQPQSRRADQRIAARKNCTSSQLALACWACIKASCRGWSSFKSGIRLRMGSTVWALSTYAVDHRSHHFQHVERQIPITRSVKQARFAMTYPRAA
jgi:hypothetical protein